jgi:hypothetical protein
VEQGGCAARCEQWDVARPVGGRCMRGAGVWGPRGPQITRRLPVYLGSLRPVGMLTCMHFSMGNCLLNEG